MLTTIIVMIMTIIVAFVNSAPARRSTSPLPRGDDRPIEHSMKRHGFGAAGAAAILLGLSSCGDVVQTEETSSDLLRVQKNISALAGTPDVHVYLDGAMHLSVRVANSSLNQRSDPEKRRTADEAARVAYASYKSRSNLEAVTVALLSDLYFVAIEEVPSPLMSELVSHVQK